MDNATYDEVSLTPLNTDETYSRLRTTQTNIKPRYEQQRRADIDETTAKIVRQSNSKDSQNNVKYNTLLIIVIVILLLFTLASIVLSMITYSQLTSKQSQLLGQIDSTEDEISALRQIIETKSNVSQNGINMVQTQIATTQISISHIITQLDNRFSDVLNQLQLTLYCGSGAWYRVAYLNMSNPSQQCPTTWREYNTSGIRACGRPNNNSGSCPAMHFLPGRTYSRVCGRIIGYQVASPDAFQKINRGNEIDLDGVNITYGDQRNHIWSFVAGLTQNNSSRSTSKCPCAGGKMSPSFIGDRYYCESGNSNVGFNDSQIYSDDPLWDGQQCEGTCCTGANSPPWFSVQLPASTYDMIEVSICCDQRTVDEDIPIELLELYVQ